MLFYQRSSKMMKKRWQENWILLSESKFFEKSGYQIGFFIASIVKKISLVNEPKVNFLQFYPKSTGLPGALRKSYCFSTIIKDDKREMAGKVDTSI